MAKKKKKKKELDPSLLPFYLPGATSPSVTMLEATTDWSKYYLDYMHDREIYWGQDAALFADAWIDNLSPVLNLANLSKAGIQGSMGWRIGLYSTLWLGIATEVVIDVLVLTTAMTIIDPSDKHNWGLDDLVSGAIENTEGTLDWSKVTSFGSTF